MSNANTALFDTAYDAYFQKVTAYVVAKCSNIEDVKDIVQETFAELYRIIQRKGALYIKNAEAMVFRIAKCKLSDYYKSKKKDRILTPLLPSGEDGDYEIDLTPDIDIEEKYLNKETLREIFDYLKKKPLTVQKIFILYYYGDNTVKEIAEELSLTQSAVKHGLYRTIEEIRKVYQKEGGQK